MTIRDFGEAVTYPHMAARELIEEVDLLGFNRPLAAVGTGFAVDRPDTPQRAPLRGADADTELAELGYGSDAIGALRVGRAI